MRTRWLLVFLLGAMPACALVLGIDDGVPRDASVESSVDAASEEASEPDVAIADVSADEAAPPGPTITVSCGPLDCEQGKELCCRTRQGSAYTYACVTDAGACTGPNELPVVCDRQEACDQDGAAPDAAIVCCGRVTSTLDAGLLVTTVRCESAASCLGPNFVMCGAPDASCPGVKKCLPSSKVIIGYDICQ